MSIGMWFIVIFGGAAGLLSALYIVIALIAVLGYKRTWNFHVSVAWNRKSYDAASVQKKKRQ